MNIALKIVATLLVVIVVVFGGWMMITLNYTYSTGERAGYIQKISERGWVCKTWEGEIAMATLPGAMPQIFAFSVRDADVAHQIEKLAGQRVSLGYEQHPGIPTSCFGDTEYFVVRVTPINEAHLPNVAPAPDTAPAAEPAAAPGPTPG
ncbi:MAG TPA: hypothetical protein VM240_06605 [Verrucomicrobiae bacterium]|nr:hypothetical protein [Verrucomicrobiae bacterium]